MNLNESFRRSSNQNTVLSNLDLKVYLDYSDIVLILRNYIGDSWAVGLRDEYRVQLEMLVRIHEDRFIRAVIAEVLDYSNPAARINSGISIEETNDGLNSFSVELEHFLVRMKGYDAAQAELELNHLTNLIENQVLIILSSVVPYFRESEKYELRGWSYIPQAKRVFILTYREKINSSIF